MNHPDLHAIVFRHVLTALICDPCARKERRNIHAKGKSRWLPPPSTGEQKPEPCKPSTRAVSMPCRPHGKSDHGRGRRRPAPGSGVAARALLGVMNVSRLCVLQHMTSEAFVSLPFCGKVCLFHCKGKWLRVEVKLVT